MTAHGVLVQPGAAGAWAWFGLELTPASTVGETGSWPGTTEQERRIDTAALEKVWLATMWDAANVLNLEIRYRADPETRLLSCALLARVFAGDQRAAVDTALTVRERLGVLPPHVHAAPLVRHEDLVAWLAPPATGADGAAVVRKRLSCGQFRRADTQLRVGVAVSPLAVAGASWEPVWRSLAGQPRPTVLSVGLTPHVAGPEFAARVGWLAQEYARLSAAGTNGPVWSSVLPPEPFAALAGPLYLDAARRYTGSLYRMRIALAADGPVSADLAQLVADRVSADSAGAPGGAVVCRPVAAESDTAWRNLTTLNHDPLVETYRQGVPADFLAHPEGVLADLVDTGEAASAFRFPYEVPRREPLFRTPARPDPADRRPTHAAGGDPGLPDL
ncbi:hypothetical protein F0L68_37430 [Solihabitans fulvus]|uniref:Uncharacterized protein n=1 Tax=Solihabitans fulvus TaxID=1892852 RepID=A0A5B2WKV3_9PSEU|nr:hypothetical protein [Solihabitans fulvus]KAA2251370.1 hypothetical protein F0L68_37430 [Solihabitans fulvus]